ncbi:hypothetical protein J010_04559 [Cryptococcus neoformans]|nr:hypothetical protein J010_04559 [Cryptococcus neoformans var. grubii]OXH48519.1 hypothetical protein J003_04532 [Cryptococcus neoformans var. grubii]OXH51116.1 hypothetical protein J002_04530 [Cryptococcus neoformans var. grubii]OXH67694.1 hypothetical protein J000_04607 [Cryptococcus neoformans var. grubii]
MASVDNRLSKHGGENAPFQSRFTKQETYEWHRICLRATEIMPSVTQVVLTAAGSGKSMVWILLPLAMKMHKQSGILILFGVTKATQDDQIRTLKRLHFEANFLNGDSPRDVRQKLAVMKGQLWAIGWGMLQNHLVQGVLGKSALTGKILSRLVGEAHTIKEGVESRSFYYPYHPSIDSQTNCGFFTSSLYHHISDSFPISHQSVHRPSHIYALPLPTPINWPSVSNAVGSIDGTHIAVKVSPRMQPAYRNRKGVVSINVLAACDFDSKFTYIIAGWEGNANDSFTFSQAIDRYNFAQLPSNRYFLADAGFPICNQLLCARTVQEVYFRPNLERWMAEHHGGIWEKVSRLTCHLPAYRCCSACEASHLSLVQARGMIGQGTDVWKEGQEIKRIITERRQQDERAIDLKLRFSAS